MARSLLFYFFILIGVIFTSKQNGGQFNSELALQEGHELEAMNVGPDNMLDLTILAHITPHGRYISLDAIYTNYNELIILAKFGIVLLSYLAVLALGTITLRLVLVVLPSTMENI